MLIDFQDISEDSRLWVYGSERILSAKEQSDIIETIGEYLKTWEYHNNPLTGSVTVLESHFIIVALDDSEFGVGGCSIDSLQRIIQELATKINVSLLNRLNIFCRLEDDIQCIQSDKLNTIANSSTLFYDLTIQYKHQLSSYLKPIAKGWCANLVE